MQGSDKVCPPRRARPKNRIRPRAVVYGTPNRANPALGASKITAERRWTAAPDAQIVRPSTRSQAKEDSGSIG
jgi:hypothetical protein